MSVTLLRSVVAAGLLLVSCASTTYAQAYCRAYLEMENRNRHVMGDVNTECGGSLHSVTWDNWGVSSDVGGVQDGFQFAGWKPQGAQLHWNSCTDDHIPDTDTIYYNHDHNGNGLGEDQFTPYANWYGSIDIDYSTSCPEDTNSDGACDVGGCTVLAGGAGFYGTHFLSLYGLDPHCCGNEFITTLYVDSGCCNAPTSCSPQSCGPGESGWYNTTSSTDVPAEAQVRLKILGASVVSQNGYCEMLKSWDPWRYDCQ